MIFLSFISGCHYSKMPSLLSDIADELELDRSRNILVCAINPQDCNSLNAFTQINVEMQVCSNDKVIVMDLERESEKRELMRNPGKISLHSAPGRYVLWSKTLFRQLQVESGTPGDLSHLSVYDPRKDALLYTSPVIEIADVKVIRTYLDL